MYFLITLAVTLFVLLAINIFNLHKLEKQVGELTTENNNLKGKNHAWQVRYEVCDRDFVKRSCDMVPPVMKENLKKIVKALNKKYAGKKTKITVREPYYVSEESEREEESFEFFVVSFTVFEVKETSSTRVITIYERPLAASFSNETTTSKKPEVYYGIAAVVKKADGEREIKELLRVDATEDEERIYSFSKKGVLKVQNCIYCFGGPAVLEVSVL